MAAEDLTGSRFGRLLVIARAANRGRRTFWMCQCDCGNMHETWSVNLKRGCTNSCGCLYRETRKSAVRHGKARTATYRSWQLAKDRCLNPKNKKYHLYGGRGISMDERWINSFDDFFTDMGERPDGATIDRIDSNKGYVPGNCRWATIEVQNNNTRSVIKIEAFGETLSISQWAKRLGILRGTMWKWINKGQTIEQIAARQVA